MKLSAKILICIALLFSFGFTGCDDEDTDPKYDLKVIGSGGSFTGWYTIDGDPIVHFESKQDEGTNTYSFEQSISSLESIYVSVDADTIDASSLQVLLYVDSYKVDSAISTHSGSTVIAKLNVILDYSETEETEETAK